MTTFPAGYTPRMPKRHVRDDLGLAEVAERVGYGSASTFSTAFSRHVGRPPGRYAREGV